MSVVGKLGIDVLEGALWRRESLLSLVPLSLCFHLLSFFLPMAAKAEDAPPVSAATQIDPSDPCPDSEARRVLEEKRRIQRNEEAADSEEYRPRESKRRRTCPAALETEGSSLARVEEEEEEEGQSSGAVRGEFSFFFDAKGQSPIETTPKFGTFRFLAADRATEEAAAAAIGKVEEAGADEGRTEKS